MITRRQFVKAGTLTGAATFVAPGVLRKSAGAVPDGTLDPTTVPKYVTPLFILPTMPRAA